MTVVVIAPHPDDEALGCGGTIAKYAKDGERVVVVVCSGGAGSHPLHKEELIVKTRRDEALAAHKVLGVAESVFFELDEFNFKDDLIEQDIIGKLGQLIRKEKPSKIFVPAIDDMHQQHREVSRMVLQIYTQFSLSCRVYTYSIWNPLSILKRSRPRLVVDVSAAHPLKLKAIREYKSQWVSTYQLTPIVVVKAFFAGLRYGHKWCEVFIQVK